MTELDFCVGTTFFKLTVDVDNFTIMCSHNDRSQEECHLFQQTL